MPRVLLVKVSAFSLHKKRTDKSDHPQPLPLALSFGDHYVSLSHPAPASHSYLQIVTAVGGVATLRREDYPQNRTTSACTRGLRHLSAAAILLKTITTEGGSPVLKPVDRLHPTWAIG